ncbi:MAG: Lipoate-protein ligase A subunit 1 [Candidatus Bathyarchaeota archaeon BA1]|nr:MAG: Lipoate-protein ligase A subunit 1 [Candidatus Bathyarchaeota archaeon BA1]
MIVVGKLSAWRLLRLETNDAFTNMAVDEAVMTARIAGLVPSTLRFYKWKPSAVSVGRFQDVFKEVDVENCRRHGVDIVRRITGGGAVYHDHDGEITYSVIVNEKELGFVDVVSAYNMICNGLIEAAKVLGIRADFHPGDPKQCPNITIGGRKISGSAQHHRRGVLLQHGTFLMDIDLEKMFTFLRVPWAKTLMDVLKVAQERLTSVKQELGYSISMEDAHQALVRGFERALNTSLIEGELTDYEWHLAEKLREEKFATDDWNLQGKHL